MRGHLVDASDDGYRARIHSALTVGTPGMPLAMELDAYAAVVLKRRPGGASGPREDVAFETIGRWQPGADEGRKFFYLTGDFNPIHTWQAFARRTRFRGCIMHGFGGFAQAFEAIRSAGHDIADIDVKFVRPLPLPGPEVLIQVAATVDAAGRRALRLVDAVQVVYNIFDQAPEDELFPLCQELGVAIIARVPFDEGSLTGTMTLNDTWPEGDWRNTYFVPENLAASVDRADQLKPLLRDGMTMPEMALRFILAEPTVSTVIPGMRKVRHVEANLAASDAGPLDEALLAELANHRWDRQPTDWSQ